MDKSGSTGAYLDAQVNIPLPFPEDTSLATMTTEVSNIKKPPGVNTLQEWSSQVIQDGKYAGTTFRGMEQADQPYATFIKNNPRLRAASLVNFKNYLMAKEYMIEKNRKSLKQMPDDLSSWEMANSTSMGSTQQPEIPRVNRKGDKRAVPQEESDKMQTEIDASRVAQIQAQIAVLQRELMSISSQNPGEQTNQQM